MEKNKQTESKCSNVKKKQNHMETSMTIMETAVKATLVVINEEKKHNYLEDGCSHDELQVQQGAMQ
jgi:hypothetical protein